MVRTTDYGTAPPAAVLMRSTAEHRGPGLSRRSQGPGRLDQGAPDRTFPAARWASGKELLRAGGLGGKTPGMPRTGGAQVMGRDDELEILTGLARDAGAGRGRLVLIEGEPGIGKTSLLRAFADDAAGLFSMTVWGVAEEFDRRLPFATVGSCLEL